MPKPALAKNKQRQEEAATDQCWADNERFMARCCCHARNVEMACTCVFGLVVVAIRRHMCKWCALAHKALLLLPSCNATCKNCELAHKAFLLLLLCNRTYKCRVLAHEALLLSPLCNATCKCHVLAHEALLLLPLCDAMCKCHAFAHEA